MKASRCMLAGLILLVPLALAAPGADRPQVVATGSHSLSWMPDTFRCVSQIEEKGASLKDVLAALAQRRQEIQKGLAALGATPDSIHFGEPHQHQLNASSRRQLQRMMQRLGRPPKGKQAGGDTTVSMSVTADWPLSGKTVEEQIQQLGDLEPKITATLKGKAAGADEDEEEDDQARQLRQMEGGGSAEPGTVTRLYVRKVATADLDQGLKEAFDEAHARASEMATAAGFKLGNLVKLSMPEQEMRMSMGEEPDMEELVQMGAYSSSRNATWLSREGTPEVRGAALKPLRYKVAVEASFELEPK